MQIHETALIFDAFLGGFVLFCLFLLRLHNEAEFRFLICPFYFYLVFYNDILNFLEQNDFVIRIDIDCDFG